MCTVGSVGSEVRPKGEASVCSLDALGIGKTGGGSMPECKFSCPTSGMVGSRSARVCAETMGGTAGCRMSSH